MGVLHPAATSSRPRSTIDCGVCFYGRAAANLDTFRRLADLTPGTSGESIELQIFGTARPDAPSNPSRRRYPFVARQDAPVGAGPAQGPGRPPHGGGGILAGIGATTPGRRGAARARFAEAAARFEAVMRPHTLAAMLAQGIYEQAPKLAATAGLPGLENRLMTGYGGFEETRLMRELWAVSRERADPSMTSSPPTATTARPRARSPAAPGGRTGRRWSQLLETYRANGRVGRAGGGRG